MGTRVEPIPTGLNCPVWDPPAETPAYVYVMFWGILKGTAIGAVEPPNLHIFKVEQRPLSPCVWEYWNPATNWWVQLGIEPGDCWLFLGDHNIFPNYYFIDHKDIPGISEYEIWNNDFVLPLLRYGYMGYGTVFWLSSVIDLSVEMGFDHVSDLMHEIFPHVDGGFVIKYCSKTLITNVKFRIP